MLMSLVHIECHWYEGVEAVDIPSAGKASCYITALNNNMIADAKPY
jgi:hypothetical protein